MTVDALKLYLSLFISYFSHKSQFKNIVFQKIQVFVVCFKEKLSEEMKHKNRLPR